MADVLEFDKASFESLVARIRESHERIGKELESLDARVRILRDAFTGQAAEAYDSAHARWTREFATMNDTLGRAATVVQDSDERFHAVDKKNAGSW